jgi:2-haloacid dehalogenase
MERVRWVTFDCFGTLVNWRHGIATGAELVAPGRGAELLEAYNRHEPVVQKELPTLRYRQVLAEAFRRACVECGVPLTDDDSAVLGVTMPFWPVFPDVAPELSALRDAGWNLALLTNCDRDIIAETQRRLPVRFDAVVTAEEVGSYKPAHEHFSRFERTHRPRPDEWVHVAQSYFHDLIPAQQLGIPRIWVNRLSETDDPVIADAVLPDLGGLLNAVEEVAAASKSVR